MRSFITCIASIIRMIMSRRMRWAGHVARIAPPPTRNEYRGLVGKPEETTRKIYT
jgi:hypothetical protein